MRVPDKEDWERLRPVVTEWYRMNTAEWIVRQLRQDGYNLSTKMLRDRLREWVVGKYARRRHVATQAPSSHDASESLTVTVNRRSTHERPKAQYLEVLNPANWFITPAPSRTPDTPVSEWNLRHSLNQISGYLDRLVENGTWRQRNEQPAFEIQKLAADAHLAISGQATGSSKTWDDLNKLGSPAINVMPKLNSDGLLTLHPRALTALLRLVVDGTNIPNTMPLWEAQTLEAVKNMFRDAARMALPKTHPILLLCSVEPDQTQDLLARQFEVMDVRLYAKISHLPDGGLFVAREQIYGARVLASLGYVRWAETKLSSVIGLESYNCPYTYAEAHRTLGYVRQQACPVDSSGRFETQLRDAEGSARLALQAFERIEMGRSNEAVYTRMCLADVLRRRGQLHEAEQHLKAGLEVWDNQDQRLQQSGCAKLVRELHQILEDQMKFAEAKAMELIYKEHFVGGHVAHDR